MTPQETTARIRLMIVEDDPVYRHFLKEVLRKMETVELVGEAATGAQGIMLGLTTKPDVLLIDLMLPDMEGIQVITQLRAAQNGLHVMLLTAQPRNDLPAELMRLGVAGFLDKTATVQEIAGGIRKLLAGGLVYSSSAGLSRVDESALPALTGMSMNYTPDVLTEREREIARMVAAAMSSKEVAAKLGLSPRTVEKHRANIYDKLRVRDVVGLTRWCLHHKLVQ